MLRHMGDQITPEQTSIFENIDDDILEEESPLHKGKIPEAESPTPRSISQQSKENHMSDQKLPDSIEATPQEKTLESLRTVTKTIASIRDFKNQQNQ